MVDAQPPPGADADGAATSAVADGRPADLADAGADDSFMSDASRGPAPEEAARVFGGDPEFTGERWDLTITGAHLQAHEGRLVTILIGLNAPEFIGQARVRIVDGAFTAFFPEVWEEFRYKPKLIWIDVDDDRVCTDGVDQVYSDYRAVRAAVLTIDPLLKSEFAVRPSFESHCGEFNGRWPKD